MVRAAGPAVEMAVPRMAILAVAATGIVVAAILLMLGMSRRGIRPRPGHRVRARTRHNRPGPRPSAAPVSFRSMPKRRPPAPLSLRPSAQRPPAASPGPRPSAHTSHDRAARTGSSGYGPPPLWGDVPDDPYGWQ